MRVGIVTVQIPFITGGAEFLAQGLKKALRERKIDAEIITIPFKPYPTTALIDHIKMSRLLDLSEINGEKIDRIITLKFPVYFCDHKNKTLWLLHQHRPAYDLFNTPYGDLHQTRAGRKVANRIRKLDSTLLYEHENIYTISQNIATKLKKYNGIEADDVVYPPPHNQTLFKCDAYENFIIYPSRFTSIKRQDLIVQAMKFAPPDLKLFLIGDYQNSYGDYIQRLIEELNLKDRVLLKNFVSEEDKIDLYARCLAVYNGVYDEDYGYVTIEAFSASKPVIIHPDAGGPLEFVNHDENGFVIDPTPQAIGEVLRKISNQKKIAIAYGQNGKELLVRKRICWDYAINKLLF